MGNLNGVRLLGLLRDKENAYLRSFSWTQRTLKFKPGGPSVTLAKEKGSPELISDCGAQRAHL